MKFDEGRNPFVIPGEKPRPRRGCPVCGGMNFGGQMIYGTLHSKCRDCGNEWQGGVGQEPQDPRIPSPPQDPKSAPNVEFMRTKESGERPVDFLTRRPDVLPDYRKGAPVPPPGEDENGF